MVVQVYSTSTQKAKADLLPMQGQLGLHSEFHASQNLFQGDKKSHKREVGMISVDMISQVCTTRLSEYSTWAGV